MKRALYTVLGVLFVVTAFLALTYPNNSTNEVNKDINADEYVLPIENVEDVAAPQEEVVTDGTPNIPQNTQEDITVEHDSTVGDTAPITPQEPIVIPPTQTLPVNPLEETNT